MWDTTRDWSLTLSADFELEIPKHQWDTLLQVAEDNSAKILRDFKVPDWQATRHTGGWQGIPKWGVVIDFAISADSNIRNEEHGKVGR